jgi:putative ABC transport system permease protein
VVGDVKYSGLDQANEPVYYEPAAQSASRPMWLIVRTRNAAAAAGPAISAEVGSLDPNVPISDLSRVSRVLYDSIEVPRFRTFLLGVFAVSALLLTCVGLYGVIGYYVARRTHEIGIRMALGATPHGVLRLVAGRAFGLAAGGVALGMAGTFGLVRFLKSMLFGIDPADTLTLSLVALLLTSVAMLAAWVPARRAARIDPVEALRDE